MELFKHPLKNAKVAFFFRRSVGRKTFDLSPEWKKPVFTFSHSFISICLSEYHDCDTWSLTARPWAERSLVYFIVLSPPLSQIVTSIMRPVMFIHQKLLKNLCTENVTDIVFVIRYKIYFLFDFIEALHSKRTLNTLLKRNEMRRRWRFQNYFPSLFRRKRRSLIYFIFCD